MVDIELLKTFTPDQIIRYYRKCYPKIRNKRYIKVIEKIVFKTPRTTYDYFDINRKKELKELPERAKRILLKDIDLAYKYVMRTKTKNWKEFEDKIYTNSRYAAGYSINILKDRWEKAEQYIKNDAYASNNYIENILKKRWPEAEKSLAKIPSIAVNYASVYLHGRYEEAEQYIKKDSEYSFIYARRIIQGRFIPGEKAILKADNIKKNYCDYLKAVLSQEEMELFIKQNLPEVI